MGTYFAITLRGLEAQRLAVVPETVEILALLPESSPESFSEVCLSTGAARLLGPVRNIKFIMVECIGPPEQVYMEFSINEEELRPQTTHVEISSFQMLSALAVMAECSAQYVPVSV
eukprot:938213_1